MMLSVWNAPLLALIRPHATFEALKHKSNWAWWPFLLLVGMQSLLWWQYYHHVDLGWFFTQGATTTSQARQAGEIAEMLSANMMAVSSSGALIVGQLVVFAVFAYYLQLMTRKDARIDVDSHNAPETPSATPAQAAADDLDNAPLSAFDDDKAKPHNGLGFRRWFGFCCWISLPVIIASLTMTVQILLSDNPQLPITALDVFSVNQLFFHVTPAHDWFNFLQSVTLIQLWSLVLAVIGIQRWAGTSGPASAVICLMPYLVIYGSWALINGIF